MFPLSCMRSNVVPPYTYTEGVALTYTPYPGELRHLKTSLPAYQLSGHSLKVNPSKLPLLSLKG